MVACILYYVVNISYVARQGPNQSNEVRIPWKTQDWNWSHIAFLAAMDSERIEILDTLYKVGLNKLAF